MIHPSLESSLARTRSEGTAAEGSRPCSASRSSISANCVAVGLPTIFCVMLRWQPMASMVQRQPRSPSCWQCRNGDDLVRLVGCPSTRRWRAVPPFLAQHRIHRGLLGTSVCLACTVQGNRVKELCGDEACEEVVIPGGDFAAESEGILSPGSPD